MGFAIRTGAGFLAPLASWVARRAAMHSIAGGAEPACAKALFESHPPVPAPQEKPLRPLRVLRVVDGASRTGAGRMVISGRMADVCAELDRLAAREFHAGSTAAR